MEDLKSFLSTVNKESLVGLSVPLPVPEEDSAIIGYYSLETGAGHFRLPQSELNAAPGLLYTDKHFPVVVHGLKRMREVFQIRDMELENHRVWDTRLMAHLLDLGRADDHGNRLSARGREYLNQDYPHMGEGLFAEDYPAFVHKCLPSGSLARPEYPADLPVINLPRIKSASYEPEGWESAP